MKKTISLRINGSERSVEVEARTTLLDLVREQFGLTGAKLGCDIQVCGACTLLVDGKVKIAGPNGQRTITVEELFLDFYTTSLAEDEILTEVVLPPLPARSGIEYIRFSSSSVVDKPCAGVAVRLTVNSDATIQTGRIVLGCVGATPVRARKAEALMTSKKLTAELVVEAGAIASQECSPTSDLRGSEQYKRAIVRTLVKRAADAAYQNALSGRNR